MIGGLVALTVVTAAAVCMCRGAYCLGCLKAGEWPVPLRTTVRYLLYQARLTLFQGQLLVFGWRLRFFHGRRPLVFRGRL